MKEFSKQEMASVISVMSIVSKKVRVGYRNAIDANSLPTDLKADRRRYEDFINTVNNFHEIESKIINNIPEEMSADEWRGFILVCSYVGYDAERRGGPMMAIADSLAFAIENIFLSRAQESGLRFNSFKN